jgi:hypothetical protein
MFRRSETTDEGVLKKEPKDISEQRRTMIDQARACLPRLLTGRRSGRPSGPFECPRHTLAYVSRAPLADITQLKARMGWEMPWYSITDSFDAEIGVDEWHGHNVFFRDGERVFRTYFINNRGDEAMGTTWSYLDITPLGRQEVWEESPEGYIRRRPHTSGGTGMTNMPPK